MNDTIIIANKQFRKFIDATEIREKIKAVGSELAAEYRDKNPIFIGILNGAFVLVADLLRACQGMDCEVTFVKMSSYLAMQSSGKVKVEQGLKVDIKDRHVIIVEDIIDTGRTINKFMENIAARSPASVRVVTLLNKPDAKVVPVQIDWTMFTIPNLFVIGYGLDLNGMARNLDSIYILDE